GVIVDVALLVYPRVDFRGAGHELVGQCVGVTPRQALAEVVAGDGGGEGDLVHLGAEGAHGAGDEAFRTRDNATTAEHPVAEYDNRGGLYQAASSVMPVCFSRASTCGSRPRKALNSSMGSWEPPFSRMFCRKAWPVSGSKMPFSSNREKASAASTSAHL